MPSVWQTRPELMRLIRGAAGMNCCQLCQLKRRASVPSILPSWPTLPIARHPRLLFPVRPRIHAVAAALATLRAALEPCDLNVIGTIRHVNQRLMAASVVVAVANQNDDTSNQMTQPLS
jgi:hypothetical protein